MGTLTKLSGTRLGEPFSALDTPTLLGVWQTAPYLHDGSAASLRDVLTVRNAGDLHGKVSTLSETELDELVAYLNQIDHGTPVAPLPFEMEMEKPPEDDAGTPGADPDGEGNDGGATAEPQESKAASACSLGHVRGHDSVAVALGALMLVARRRRRRMGV